MTNPGAAEIKGKVDLDLTSMPLVNTAKQTAEKALTGVGLELDNFFSLSTLLIFALLILGFIAVIFFSSGKSKNSGSDDKSDRGKGDEN